MCSVSTSAVGYSLSAEQMCECAVIIIALRRVNGWGAPETGSTQVIDPERMTVCVWIKRM